MEFLLNLLFPPHCPVCDSVRAIREPVCCPECRRKLLEIGDNACFLCGRPTEETEEYCDSCRKRKPSFERGFSAFAYQGAAREAVLGFKFSGRETAGAFFAQELLRMHGEEMRLFGADAVVPVPLHPRKLRMRGYNQAEILAKHLAEGLQIPLEAHLLIRKRNTRPQKELSAAARLRNLTEAFAVPTGIFSNKERRMPESILLVDDILTTGSTLEACARIAKRAGVRRVAVVTVCCAGEFFSAGQRAM